VGVVLGLAGDTYCAAPPHARSPRAWLGSLVVPWFVLALPTAGMVVRMLRSSMSQMLGDDYVRTPAAKGLSERVVLRRHALPRPTRPWPRVWHLDGDRHVERPARRAGVRIPGVLRMTIRATLDGDFVLLQGLVVVSTVLVIAGTYVTDVVAAWLDPRVR
jgi:peptide/nickel transport system permease protein